MTALDFTCPRCHAAASARYYGPCETCRADLVATLGSEARVIDAVAYEPKMNVTPNAIHSQRDD